MGQLMQVEKVRGQELLGIREQMVTGVLSIGADFMRRVIYLIDEISFPMASRFLIVLQQMDASRGPIRVVLMSTGGAEPAGWAIYDAIRSARNEVVVDATGAVWSMATAILQAGHVRRMTPECRLMVHAGTSSMGDDIDQRTLISIGAELKRTNLRYQQVLAQRTGRTELQVAQDCNDETYFSAAEALRAGFIDAIVPYAKPLPKAPAPKRRVITKKRKRR